MTVAFLTPPEEGTPVDGLPGFVRRYSTGNGARIHYVLGGAGPAVLLLHGFAYTWEDWRRLMAPLAQLIPCPRCGRGRHVRCRPTGRTDRRWGVDSEAPEQLSQV